MRRTEERLKKERLKKKPLQKQFDSIARNMLNDFERFSTINHPLDKGLNRQNILKAFLQKFLPKRYSIGNGQIVNYRGEISKEQDIVIYDGHNSPLLINEEHSQIFPIESVYATIEVKSVLSSTELLKAIDNIKSVRKLKDILLHVKKDTQGVWKHVATEIGPKIELFNAIFAFKSDAKVSTLYGNFIKMSKEGKMKEQPSFTCVLDKGYLLYMDAATKKDAQDGAITGEITTTPKKDDILARGGSTENRGLNLLMFYLLLLEHLIKESTNRKPFSIEPYLFTGVISENWIINYK